MDEIQLRSVNCLVGHDCISRYKYLFILLFFSRFYFSRRALQVTLSATGVGFGTKALSIYVSRALVL